ncbi:oligoendopeptidase F [Mahella australiensis]|uniref:Oligopeptidase F n=1 Tax=Mahella australiensis (strain DSM 15567 / CIP 107919 / 50-1 BON) TaxID=697281 RepID=F4A138_MAHA5|nr:oligoendopeptidase F [Mahella australiensis]AEE95941.1 oligopeptidase F [Mahella australiensis 50-1 BON]
MNALPKREEIDKKYKWHLEDIYSSDDEWERDFKRLKDMVPAMEKYKGRLNSADSLYNALKLRDEISQLAERLFTYARMRRDEDNANTKYQALADRAMSLIIEIQSALSFIVPEILAIPADEVYGYMIEEPNLELYRHYIDDIMRQKAHVLSASEERILAQAGEMAEAADIIFTMINDADIKFPSIKDENGNEVELTKGRYMQFMESQDRRVRKDAFEALYDTYGKLKNTLSATLSSNVKKDIFFSRVRKYPSSLAASLDDDNVPTSVYDGLIKAIHDNMDLMYRYVKLRKKMLGVDELHMYDLYVPLVPDIKVKVSYEEAIDKVLEGLRPLGQEYISLLEHGFKNGWIDAYENQGKTSGAYSWGCYGVHPFVLLNFQGTLDDIFTIAHEMGHSLHTHYSFSAQPYIYAEYRIFVAEVASTLNEALLMDHMLKTTDQRSMKLYLINHYLEQFRGTVYRQTMFAEFEKIVHDKAETGESLTPDMMSSIYHNLNEKYYGPNIVVDDRIDLEWSRIPHFYSSFYVYKYATGFSAATALSQQILSEGKTAVDRYINFLKSGGSDYPIELLKKAGVDMTTPKPVEAALKVFAGLLDQMESMI